MPHQRLALGSQTQSGGGGGGLGGCKVINAEGG
jgi:hypothetical protein